MIKKGRERSEINNFWLEQGVTSIDELE